MKKIVLYSGKGGVGKSPLTIEMAIRIAKSKRVLILDLSVQHQATTGMNCEPSNAAYDLVSSRESNIKPHIRETRLPNVAILTNGDMGNMAQSVASTRHFQITWLEQVVAQVDGDYDVALIDTDQGGLFVEMAIAAADMIVSPVRCQQAHIEALALTPATVSTIRQAVGKQYPMTVVVPICSGNSKHAERMFAMLKEQIGTHQPDPSSPNGLDNWALFTVEDAPVPATVEIDNARGRVIEQDGVEIPAPLTLLEYRPKHPVTAAYNALADELSAVLWGGQ